MAGSIELVEKLGASYNIDFFIMHSKDRTFIA